MRLHFALVVAVAFAAWMLNANADANHLRQRVTTLELQISDYVAIIAGRLNALDGAERR